MSRYEFYPKRWERIRKCHSPFRPWVIRILETQGQIAGTRKKSKWVEKNSTMNPSYFSAHFDFFLVPTICSCVSEDGSSVAKNIQE